MSMGRKTQPLLAVAVLWVAMRYNQRKAKGAENRVQSRIIVETRYLVLSEEANAAGDPGKNAKTHAHTLFFESQTGGYTTTVKYNSVCMHNSTRVDEGQTAK